MSRWRRGANFPIPPFPVIIDVYVNVNQNRQALMATFYSISDLAREFDLTTRAIRFYEDMGLLQPERSGPAGRNRVYSGRDRTRLKLTLRAKRLGLSLTEAKDLIDMYDSPRDTGPQARKILGCLGRSQAPTRSTNGGVTSQFRRS